MRANYRSVGRRGFSLVIMLVVLSLLGVFSLLAARLFLSTLRTMRAAHDGQMQSVQTDNVVHMLRADVWNAIDAKLVDGKLVIKRAGEPTATWTVAEDSTIVRTEEGSKGSNRWEQLPVKLTFEPSGAAVLVRIDEGPRKPKSQVILVSQLQLAGGQQR